MRGADGGAYIFNKLAVDKPFETFSVIFTYCTIGQDIVTQDNSKQ